MYRRGTDRGGIISSIRNKQFLNQTAIFDSSKKGASRHWDAHSILFRLRGFPPGLFHILNQSDGKTVIAMVVAYHTGLAIS